ncbi:MAG: FtsX-like permease family protein [Candidatus Merdivicinus sp.]
MNGITAIVDGFAEQSVPSLDLLTEEQQNVIASADTLLTVVPEGTFPSGTSLTALLESYIEAPLSSKERIGTKITAITDPIAAGLDEQDAQLAEARAAIEQLQTGITEGEKQLTEGKATLDETEKQLAETRVMLDEKDQQLSDGWKELAKQKKEGREELENARIELENGEAELADAKAEYEKEKEDSAQEIADAKQEIADAEQDLADLKEPTWYVWNRDNNPDYSSYGEDTEKVDAVAAVFPVFFILVAALVCLTTMTRMVEEQRTQIGTLKALGYSRGAIMAKYIGYAAAASVSGSIIGLAIGFKLFPYIIINAYRIMYELPDPVAPVRWGLGSMCLIVAVLCMCLTTFAACAKQTAEVPSQLMRPKAPKNGKRVFLEKIGFIWKRLNFSQKVTVRNFFRYKKRVLMTVVGISGCTALMLTGFGLRYAILSIGEKQYENVFVYDTMVSLDDKQSASELSSLAEQISELDGVEQSMPVASRSIDIQGNKKVLSITLMVPEDPQQFGNYIDLHERVGGESLALQEDSVIINEKLSRLMDAQVGDTITLVNPNGKPIPVTVSGISENYALNYVYMTPTQYQKEFREDPVYSTILLNYQEGTIESTLSEEILNLGDGVLAVTHTSGISGAFEDMLGSLNNIVWVIIVSAGLLAFVVLYNLANINVNERIRELATIKVLGFYDNEVTNYITRENNISSLLGMIIGLILGIGLERFVIRTAEVDMVMFAPDIAWYCFVLAGLLTLVFTMIVNLVLHFHLKKIDMVESLKSVE